ncbi:DUF3331 domain-containing protein [Trinickia terrae]|uniref:DUF3331 domain-containing protein n=1 Tax=Trinickia terrae TaxID=2571161 RepID=A0A4U1HGP6_9BURK|nr:DUF3331 domain-containing protein [Trinickia terrae]TKC80191.1 DUF3331 domain-containing protein [Trinickia terrae]
MPTALANDACWRAALRLLEGGSHAWAERQPAPCREAGAARAAKTDVRRTCVVRVVERVSNKIVVVYWCDPTACRYGDQLWKADVAKRRGRCALSGAPIETGDAIYRPRPTRPRPVNATAMMLASEVERVSPD